MNRKEQFAYSFTEDEKETLMRALEERTFDIHLGHGKRNNDNAYTEVTNFADAIDYEPFFFEDLKLVLQSDYLLFGDLEKKYGELAGKM